MERYKNLWKWMFIPMIIMHPKETVIVSDIIAYDFGHSRVYYTNVEGKAVEPQDKFLVIIKKVKGKWKLHRELASGSVKNTFQIRN